MITTRKQSAPAAVEGATRATPCDVRGDGLPLRPTYDGPASLRNVRDVVYVSLDSGQAHTYQLKRSEACPTRWPSSSSRDVRAARVLAFDADASAVENEGYAALVLNCLIANGTATTVPLSVVRAVMAANFRQAEQIRALEQKVQQLTCENEALYKRSRR